MPQALAEPVYRIFSVLWDRIFSNDIPQIVADLTKRVQTSVQSLFESLCEKVIQCGVQPVRVLRLSQVLQDFFQHRLGQLFENLTSAVNERQKDVSRTFTPQIQEAMNPGFQKAMFEKGQGCFARMKQIMLEHTREVKSKMVRGVGRWYYQHAASEAVDALHPLPS